MFAGFAKLKKNLTFSLKNFNVYGLWLLTQTGNVILSVCKIQKGVQNEKQL